MSINNLCAIMWTSTLLGFGIKKHPFARTHSVSGYDKLFAEVPEVVVQLLGWKLTLCLYVQCSTCLYCVQCSMYLYVQYSLHRCGWTVSQAVSSHHPRLGKPLFSFFFVAVLKKTKQSENNWNKPQSSCLEWSALWERAHGHRSTPFYVLVKSGYTSALFIMNHQWPTSTKSTPYPWTCQDMIHTTLPPSYPPHSPTHPRGIRSEHPPHYSTPTPPALTLGSSLASPGWGKLGQECLVVSTVCSVGRTSSGCARSKHMVTSHGSFHKQTPVGHHLHTTSRDAFCSLLVSSRWYSL